jgi:hypothetical protein
MFSPYSIHSYIAIEDLKQNPAVSVLSLFASLQDDCQIISTRCSQNQTTVSDTLRLFSDF